MSQPARPFATSARYKSRALLEHFIATLADGFASKVTERRASIRWRSTLKDFVDEWVHQPWKEMQNWTSKDTRARLEKWHKEADGEKWLPEIEFVQRCQRGGLWQIAAAELEGERTYYLLVLEGTGGRHEMLDISTKRQPGCPGETPPDFHDPFGVHETC